MARRLIVVALVLLATGCVLGPNYKRPAVQSPPAWRDIPVAEAESLANVGWWQVYDDPTLQELIRTALAENRDLKIAVERIEEARARYGFTKAEFWPTVDLNAAAGALQFNAGSLLHTPGGDAGSTGATVQTDIYSASVSVSWELDFFGRVRRATEAQRALFLGTEEARRSAVLALVSDVARAYFELCSLDRQLDISRRTVISRQESVQLARDRFEGGLTGEMDFRQAEAELHRVEAIIFQLEAQVAGKENELSVLIGRNPGPIIRGRSLEEQKLPSAVPAGLPSELLERRPDIREAEQTLAASTANIGEAKALLYPRIALTGAFGTSSTEIDTLFESPSRSWNIIGSLLQPIFDAGKNRRRVEITESRQRQTLYAYESTILKAFRETEDSLVAYRKSGQQRFAQGERVKAERKVVELAELRYRGGVSAYLEVLDAQRSLFNSELDEAQTVGSHLVSLVQLYKALGGGWPSAPESQATGAPAARKGLPRPILERLSQPAAGQPRHVPGEELVMPSVCGPIRSRRGPVMDVLQPETPAGDAPGMGSEGEQQRGHFLAVVGRPEWRGSTAWWHSLPGDTSGSPCGGSNAAADGSAADEQAGLEPGGCRQRRRGGGHRPRGAGRHRRRSERDPARRCRGGGGRQLPTPGGGFAGRASGQGHLHARTRHGRHDGGGAQGPGRLPQDRGRIRRQVDPGRGDERRPRSRQLRQFHRPRSSPDGHRGRGDRRFGGESPDLPRGAGCAGSP